MEAKKLNTISFSEYLDIERTTNSKYEYHNGTIFAMAGGTINHGLICGNIFGEIRTGLRKKKSSCRVMNSEIKLHIASSNCFLYPDAMVICGDIKKSTEEFHAVTNPVAIIEVLSKSSASYDRGDKFFLYRELPSLQEYILIEQKKTQVEIYKRQGDLWKITRVTGLTETFYISALELEISMKEVYWDVEGV